MQGTRTSNRSPLRAWLRGNEINRREESLQWLAHRHRFIHLRNCLLTQADRWADSNKRKWQSFFQPQIQWTSPPRGDLSIIQMPLTLGSNLKQLPSTEIFQGQIFANIISLSPMSYLQLVVAWQSNKMTGKQMCYCHCKTRGQSHKTIVSVSAVFSTLKVQSVRKKTYFISRCTEARWGKVMNKE